MKFRRLLSCFLSLFIFSSLFCFHALGGPEDLNKQAQIEAAFIYQFTNYITWPGELDTAKAQNFVISIVGQNAELFTQLGNLAKVKKVKGNSIEVLSADASHLRKSHMIIVASKDPALLAEVARKVKGQAVLIISYGDDFAKKGSMINFFIDEDRLRFEINLNAVKKENLQVGSQLLNLARIIND